MPILITRQYIIPSHAPKVKFNQVYFVGRTEFRVYCCQSSQSAGWTCIMRVLVPKKVFCIVFICLLIDRYNQSRRREKPSQIIAISHVVLLVKNVTEIVGGLNVKSKWIGLKTADRMLLMQTQSATFTCFT